MESEGGNPRRSEQGEMRITYAPELCPLGRCSTCTLSNVSTAEEHTSVASPLFPYLLPTLLQRPQSPISGHRRSIPIPLPHTMRYTLAQSLSPWCLIFKSTSMAADLHCPPRTNPSIELRQLLLPGSIRWDFCNVSEVLHPLRSTAKSEITVSRPRHQNEAICGILVGAARQTRNEHCRSRRAHPPLIPFLGFGSPPLLRFMLSPLEPGHQIAAER